MDEQIENAPGWPGIPARWTSSAKSGVGTALSQTSRVWFSLSHGILNEIYYPRLDQACVRDLGLIVTDGREFFSEEKRHAAFQVDTLALGVPAYKLVNTCQQGRYRIEKTILTDPQRDVLLQQVKFEPLQGNLDDYQLYVLIAPHLGNRGADNSAWVDDYKGLPTLCAQRDGNALALASSASWVGMSAGFVGVSDGWQDLSRNKRMTWFYRQALDGNVALTGEIDLQACGGSFVLALGFGLNVTEASHRALASLQTGFQQARSEYIRGWERWHKGLLPLDDGLQNNCLYRTSMSVLRSHEAKRFPGGLIASLSVPWGFNKGDEDLGGYHLVWPRDLVEAAGGLLAAGAHADVRRILYYLQATQESDGHWPQNMWLDGTPYWSGVQMDETAFPVLLVDLAWRAGAITNRVLKRLWPMIRKAVGFILRNGPVTDQDRWEEDSGYSPFTLAVEIAALLAAADLGELNGESEVADLIRQTADAWNDCIDRWTYVTGTDLAERVGVEGYYVRIAPPEVAEAGSPNSGFVPIKNRPPGYSRDLAAHIVSVDALALVRFGLRAANDVRILNTIRVIDDLLKVETPMGPAWYRYNGDGYGEHEDGSPFDGTGRGRLWPLLTGERAHYELAAGRVKQARQLLKVMENFTSEGGLFPEQVWDSADIPERELYIGKPSGSAMPLVWAHAEYIKLCRSLRDGIVFDMPPQTVHRYQIERIVPRYSYWQLNQKIHTVKVGKILRISLPEPATIRWSIDAFQRERTSDSLDVGLGVNTVDLPTSEFPAGTNIQFTILWKKGQEGNQPIYSILVDEA